MVRIVIGTLLMVNKKHSPEYILDIINSKNRNLGGVTAPAYGLYLYNIEY